MFLADEIGENEICKKKINRSKHIKERADLTRGLQLHRNLMYKESWIG